MANNPHLATVREYVEMHPWGEYTAIVTENGKRTLRRFSPPQMVMFILLTPSDRIPAVRNRIRLQVVEGFEKRRYDLVAHKSSIILNHWPDGIPDEWRHDG